MSTFRFLKMFIRQPKVNASIIPSSKRAAQGMVSGLDLNAMKYVVELGPGTGVMTDMLAEQHCLTSYIVYGKYQIISYASCIHN